eukprot:648137-Pelagomonas_calceolata.AAC.3
MPLIAGLVSHVRGLAAMLEAAPPAAPAAANGGRLQPPLLHPPPNSHPPAPSSPHPLPLRQPSPPPLPGPLPAPACERQEVQVQQAERAGKPNAAQHTGVQTQQACAHTVLSTAPGLQSVVQQTNRQVTAGPTNMYAHMGSWRPSHEHSRKQPPSLSAPFALAHPQPALAGPPDAASPPLALAHPQQALAAPPDAASPPTPMGDAASMADTKQRMVLWVQRHMQAMHEKPGQLLLTEDELLRDLMAFARPPTPHEQVCSRGCWGWPPQAGRLFHHNRCAS